MFCLNGYVKFRTFSMGNWRKKSCNVPKVVPIADVPLNSAITLKSFTMGNSKVVMFTTGCSDVTLERVKFYQPYLLRETSLYRERENPNVVKRMFHLLPKIGKL